jgi:hypothetical protein
VDDGSAERDRICARPRRQVRAPQARLYLNGSTITPMMRTG